jgi:N-acetylglucosamine-6-phosphate deacetylase
MDYQILDKPDQDKPKKSMIYLHNSILYTPTDIIDRGALIFHNNKIIALGPATELPYPAGAQSIDLGGMTLVPGFIDLQINGAFGMDFTTHPETIWQVGERLTQFGVTSFLPTIVSSPPDAIRLAQTVLQNGAPTGYQGARVLGLHLEGPYLNPEKCGAHNPAYLRLPDESEYSHWNPSSHVRLVTLAPELEGASDAIKTLDRNGVVVGAGHSLASQEQAQTGFEAGIRYATHLFNAMPPLDHRQPGLIGAIMGNPEITTGMIVDGVHLHPNIVNLAWKTLGTTRVNLVTDSMASLGMPPGEYQLGDRNVIVDSNSVRLEDGRLAGSLLSLDQALRNLCRYTGCNLKDALSTVTQVPARLLHLEKILGRLKVGLKADLVLLSPEAQVAREWVNGHQVIPALA